VVGHDVAAGEEERALSYVCTGSYAVAGGVGAVVPVDLHIRGCPPSPTALLTGLIALVG